MSLLFIASTIMTGHAADYSTELFGSRTFDLEGISLTFTPDGSSTYSIEGSRMSALPVDPADHTPLNMADDTFFHVHLAPYFFDFYGNTYQEAFIGSNGYITFGQGDSTWGVTTSNHFAQARISTLYDDWNDVTSIGAIKYKQLSDRLVVTFEDVKEYGSSVTNKATFQTELFYADNSIRMSWLYVDNPRPTAIVGLSAGTGAPGDWANSDLSSYVTDWDEDGILDSWEKTHFGSINNCIPSNNFDGDLLDNISEYICGSDPKDETSGFTTTITSSPSGPVIGWTAIAGRQYSISKSENLAIEALAPYKQNILFPHNSYTDTVSNVLGIYTVHVKMID